MTDQREEQILAGSCE